MRIEIFYSLIIGFISSNLTFSQKLIKQIENEKYLLKISIDTISTIGSSHIKFGNNINAKNISLVKFFELILPEENVIKANNLPVEKYNFDLITFKNEGYQEEIITDLGNLFAFSLKIKDVDAKLYELKTENFNLLNEKIHESIGENDSIIENDNLVAYVKVEELSKLLFKRTKEKYFYKGFLEDKYYFNIDLKNINKSLKENGLKRIEAQIKNKLYYFEKL